MRPVRCFASSDRIGFVREAAFSQRFLNPNPLILKPPNALGIREIFWGHWRNLFPSVSVCSILHHIRDSKRLSIFFSRFKDSAIALVNLKQFRVIGKTPFIIYLLLFETFRNGDFFFVGVVDDSSWPSRFAFVLLRACAVVAIQPYSEL